MKTRIGLHAGGIPVHTKGMLVFGTLIAYSLVIAAFAFNQKNQLLRDFDAIQHTLETEAVLKQAEVSTFHGLMALLVNDNPADPEALRRIDTHRAALASKQAALAQRLPGATLHMDELNAAWAALVREPSRPRMEAMAAELVALKQALEQLSATVQKERTLASARYRELADAAAMTALLLGMLGLALLGAAIGLFFGRLTDDLGTLQQRALDVVKGYRGAPLAVTRHDEVGKLMEAVNQMADTLDQREKQVMVERQKHFHKEKMAAIGALAAGVSHEIGNPIAAISGIAQEMMERRAASVQGCSPQDCYNCKPDVIHAQAERLAAITREIAEFASPREAEPQFLDLNEQLRSTSRLIRFDRRMQKVALRLDLDSQLPAVYGVADQLTQVVMNLLVNAMDALDGVAGRDPAITITTRSEGGRVCLEIGDNGVGIEDAVLQRVFEAFFTTKPAGKGTGLGLSLSYAIVRRHGGTIELNSTPGAGTRVQVLFPLDDNAFNPANA
jgi:signal transduction histidine kinase